MKRFFFEEIMMTTTFLIAKVQVDFLIKSHPLDAPSNYKLSDLTLKVLSSSFSQKKKKRII